MCFEKKKKNQLKATKPKPLHRRPEPMRRNGCSSAQKRALRNENRNFFFCRAKKKKTDHRRCIHKRNVNFVFVMIGHDGAVVADVFPCFSIISRAIQRVVGGQNENQVTVDASAPESENKQTVFQCEKRFFLFVFWKTTLFLLRYQTILRIGASISVSYTEKPLDSRSVGALHSR